MVYGLAVECIVGLDEGDDDGDGLFKENGYGLGLVF